MNYNTYRFQYGNEWRLITKNAKRRKKYRCKKCKKKFKRINLDVHHLIPISYFVSEGYVIPGPLHRCYGIRTRRPWHTANNLEVLCMKCHSQCYHPHLIPLYQDLNYTRCK